MIRFPSFFAAALLGVLLSGSLAIASSSEWHQTEGGRVRLVSTGLPDAAGKLRGVLEIQLDPGWKTYWRDPGDSGVPPTIDVKESLNVAGVTVDFPAPQRHDDGAFKWAGYDYPIALPLTFTLAEPGKPAIVDAAIFLGLCQTICVPLQATLALDPGSDPDNGEDAAVVATAFAALPGAETPDFRVKVVSDPGANTIVVEASFPGDPASAELFVAGEEGYSFTTPVRSARDGKTFFSMNVSLPARIGTGKGLHYTLATDAGAVSGLLPYF